MSETKLLSFSFPVPIPQGHTIEVMKYLSTTFVRDVDTNITYGKHAQVSNDGVIKEPERAPKIERAVVTRVLIAEKSTSDTVYTNIWVRPLAESEGTYR